MFGMQTAYLAKKIIIYFQIVNGFSRPTKNFLICEILRVWEVRTRNLKKKQSNNVIKKVFVTITFRLGFFFLKLSPLSSIFL